MWSTIQPLLRILPLFQVLVCVEMKKTGTVFTGTEGGSVEIDCDYPDEYKYVKKYFCRHPCSGILIESVKNEEVISKGRYSIVSTLSTKSFSVTIRNLSFKDSGVYYCGVEEWGKDIYTKVKVYVRAEPTATPLETTKPTDRSSVYTVIYLTDSSSTFEQAPITQSMQVSVLNELPVYGGVFGLFLCCVFVALVLLYRTSTNTSSISLKTTTPENLNSDPPPHQQDICCSYDELTMVMYSFTGPPDGDCASESCSVVQYHSD